MERVLDGVHKIAVADMVAEASVRKHMRDLYMRYAVVSTGIFCTRHSDALLSPITYTYRQTQHPRTDMALHAACLQLKASCILTAFLQLAIQPILPCKIYGAFLQVLVPAWRCRDSILINIRLQSPTPSNQADLKQYTLCLTRPSSCG